MKNRKRTLIPAFALAMIIGASATLGGCGVKYAAHNISTSPASASGIMAESNSFEGIAEEMAMEDADVAAPAESPKGDVPSAKNQQKLIVTWNLSIETENYESFTASIKASLDGVGGYIESESEYTDYDELRCNSMTVRIPSDKADAWIAGFEGKATIRNKSQSRQDVTLDYVDLDSHIEALQTEKEAMQNLMKKAESMEDILTIQTHLTDLNYQLDSLESQMRLMENQITYTTFYLDVNEVKNEIAAKRSIGQEIIDTFRESTHGIGQFFHRLLVGILGYSVIIIIVIAIIAFAMIGCRRIIKKKKSKKQLLLEGEKTDEQSE